MADAFRNEKAFVVAPLTAELNFFLAQNNMDTYVQCSGLLIRVNPITCDDMSQFLQSCQLYYLMKDLKQYRPQRKPITDDMVHSQKLLKNQVLRHKRKLIIRDWFFYVVWA